MGGILLLLGVIVFGGILVSGAINSYNYFVNLRNDALAYRQIKNEKGND